MLSSLKPMSILMIILSVLNAAGTALTLMVTSPYLDPNTNVAVAAFMGTTSLLLLLTGIALLRFNSDMETNIESINTYVASLKKRIDELEKKI